MTSHGKRRAALIGALSAAAIVIAIMALSGIGDNLVYSWSPSELIAARQKAVGATVRLGGQVEVGSLERVQPGEPLRFRVTDGKESVAILANAVPPAMFREGIGVVIEGTLREDGRFETQRLMVKHNNEYQAPEEGEMANAKELERTLEGEV